MSRVITCPDCGKSWTGLRMEHCPVAGCHQTFSGAEAGDKHRTGLYGVPENRGGRRCLTPAEMLAYDTGRSANRFWQDDRGTWHFGERREMP